MSLSPNDFGRRILHWLELSGRKDLPWQRERTPYRVWVSEIMLQQTQVAVVIPYFERFMARFPTLLDLADAPVDDVLAHWSGLGYYARARNLHRAAREIRDQHAGRFPTDLEAVEALPGIGRSTAGAVLSLARDQRHPILDGNVKRVLARHFGVEGWPGQTQVIARLWQLSESCTPIERAGDYNQGMMDLGATLCTRGKPACDRCPVQDGCVAFDQGRQAELPAPRPKKTLPTRSIRMLAVVTPDDEILLERRPPTGIWGGLWSLPETSIETAPEQWCQDQMEIEPTRVEILGDRRHTFSHYRVNIGLARIEIDKTSSRVQDQPNRRWEPLASATELGLPAPVTRILDDLRKANRT